MLEQALLLIFGPVVLVVVVVLLASWRYEQRTRHLRQFAEDMGFTFVEQDATLASELFGAEGGPRVLNALRGQAEGLEVAVFDLHWAVPSASHIVHIRYTMLLFRDTEASWPAFSLRPAFFLKRLGGFHRSNTRLFAQDRGFGRAYILEAEDEAAVSDLFPEAVRRFFARTRGLWIEANRERMFYTRGKLLPAHELHAFLAEAFRVRKVLETGEVEVT